MNGRIQLIDAPNHLLLYEQKTTNNFEGIACQSTPLSSAFFSAANQQILQNGIRAGVYNMSNQKYTIATQPAENLKLIMRYIFMENSTTQHGNVTDQISFLNNAVLNYSVPKFYEEAKGYLIYLRDVKTLVVPLATPISTTQKDTTLELKNFF
jgi:hypothetical protein